MPVGGQPGNQNAKKGKEATRALEKALAEESTGVEGEYVAKFSALVDIWRKQIEKAKEGDLGAAQMIVDRLEGKPKQALTGGDEDDQPIKVTKIELVPFGDDSSS